MSAGRMPRARSKNRDTGLWRRRPGTRWGGTSRALSVLLAVGVAVPLAATAANAEVTLTTPHSIEVLPGLDIVGVTGYDEPIAVEVWRDGVKVGSSGAPQEPGDVIPDEDEIATPVGKMLEINHDGGACWVGHTPDIIAGDEIRVVTADGDPSFEKMDVANISANAPEAKALDADGDANDLVMTGRALTAAGLPMDPVAFSVGEAEIVQPAFRDVGVPGWDRRVLRAAVTGVALDGDTTFPNRGVGTLEYDELTGEWVATWKNLPVPTADRASFLDLALDGEHNFILSEGPGNEDVGGLGTTIAQPGDASGPAQGCPPGSSYGVTGSTPANVNVASSAQENLVISGTAYNANAVEVTLQDVDGTTLSVPGVVNNPALLDETTEQVAPLSQTWTATVPMSEVLDRLDDGELVASAVYDYVVETSEVRTTPATDESGNPVLEAALDSDGRAVPDTDPSLYRDPDSGELVQATDPVTGEPLVDVGGTPVYTVQPQVDVSYYGHSVEQRTGTTHTLLKDLVAPGLPTASVPGGEYPRTQHVDLNAQDEIEETVRYRTGGPAVADPTAGTRAARGQIAISATQTLKARSFDRAGNGGPVLTETYTISGLVTGDVPGRPGKPKATARKAAARVQWTPPADDGGSPITGYRIYIDNNAGTTQFEVRVRNLVSYRVTGLSSGTRYRFSVAAINANGEGPQSPWSNWVRPNGPAGQPGGDTRPPRVLWCLPRANDDDVHRRDNVRCKMSEPVRRVRYGTARLKVAATGARVPAAVRYHAATRVITIDPKRDLAKRTRYRIILTKGIRDRAGNHLTPVRRRFTTHS